MDGVNVRWNEEVIKWLAVGMCLAMVAVQMVSITVGDIGLVYLAKGDVLAGLGGISGGILADSGAALAVGLSTAEALSTLALVGLIGTGVGAGILIG